MRCHGESIHSRPPFVAAQSAHEDDVQGLTAKAAEADAATARLKEVLAARDRDVVRLEAVVAELQGTLAELESNQGVCGRTDRRTKGRKGGRKGVQTEGRKEGRKEGIGGDLATDGESKVRVHRLPSSQDPRSLSLEVG